MKSLFVIPLLMLFGGHLALAEGDVWLWSRSPSVDQTATVSSAASSITAASGKVAIAEAADTRPLVHERTQLRVAKASTKSAPAAPSKSQNAITSQVTPATNSSTPPPSHLVTYTADIEAEVLRLINTERSTHDRVALTADNDLAIIARAHSADMGLNDFFDHENLSGCGSSCRVSNAGYVWRAVGENIYMMSGYKLSAAEAAERIVDAWMNSTDHRANILGSQFTRSGIGLWGDGTHVYATALFARPR